MKLKKVEIHKYKCVSDNQQFLVEDDITILVGMNESGKTSALEVVAKTNYFQPDEQFKFNLIHDYPRKEKKNIDKTGEDPKAVTCYYEIDDSLLGQIEDEIGKGVLLSVEFKNTTRYSNGNIWGGVTVDRKKFVAIKTEALGISSKSLNEKLEKVNSLEELEVLKSEYSEEKYTEGISSFEKFYKNDWGWESDPIAEYVARIYLNPNTPKFLYYDEYFSLPSRISIEELQKNELNENEYKTARALFELADINTEEILNADNFENFIAELEATEAIISQELFQYWQTNKNLNIAFQVDKIERKDQSNNTRIVGHILDIRVKSKGVSLPLRNREVRDLIGSSHFLYGLRKFRKIKIQIMFCF